MIDPLLKCCVRDCPREAVVVVAKLLFCAQHALEREKETKRRRTASLADLY
jgi:hypothetical protein